MPPAPVVPAAPVVPPDPPRPPVPVVPPRPAGPGRAARARRPAAGAAARAARTARACAPVTPPVPAGPMSPPVPRSRRFRRRRPTCRPVPVSSRPRGAGGAGVTARTDRIDRARRSRWDPRSLRCPGCPRSRSWRRWPFQNWPLFEGSGFASATARDGGCETGAARGEPIRFMMVRMRISVMLRAPARGRPPAETNSLRRLRGPILPDSPGRTICLEEYSLTRRRFRRMSRMARRERSAGSVRRACSVAHERARRVAVLADVGGRTRLRQLQSLQRSDPRRRARPRWAPRPRMSRRDRSTAPGQPCAVCHRDGGEDPTFVFAGTVYRDPVEKIAVADAKVVLTDAAGHTFMTTTNCVGNFYVKTSEFQRRRHRSGRRFRRSNFRGTWSRRSIARHRAPSVTTTRPVPLRRAICS